MLDTGVRTFTYELRVGVNATQANDGSGNALVTATSVAIQGLGTNWTVVSVSPEIQGGYTWSVPTITYPAQYPDSAGAPWKISSSANTGLPYPLTTGTLVGYVYYQAVAESLTDWLSYTYCVGDSEVSQDDDGTGGTFANLAAQLQPPFGRTIRNVAAVNGLLAAGTLITIAPPQDGNGEYPWSAAVSNADIGNTVYPMTAGVPVFQVIAISGN